jgi:release factor glutamine methyltransferase
MRLVVSLELSLSGAPKRSEPNISMHPSPDAESQGPESQKAAGQKVDSSWRDRLGPDLLLAEFVSFTGALKKMTVRHARQSAQETLEALARDETVVMTGPYAYIDAVYRYCQQHAGLVGNADLPRFIRHGKRRALVAKIGRRRLHHLLVAAQGERLLEVEDAPDLHGVQDWLQEPPGPATYLLPLRRLQRMLSDMQRASDGIYVEALDDRITVLPQVYVPANQSVPAMFAQQAELLAGKKVLDLGTGSGILALIAVRLGATKVVACDLNPHAVRNARLNARRLQLDDRLEVKEAGHLFGPVGAERFDRILFNAPWVKGEPKNMYERGLYDAGYRVLDGFCAGAADHLTPGGSVLLQFSDIGPRGGENATAHLLRSVEANGLTIHRTWRLERASRVNGLPACVFLYDIRPV